MSSSVEAPKEEQVQKEENVKKEKIPLYQRVKQQWQLMLKCLELLLCGACVGVAFEPFSEISKTSKIPLHHVGVLYTAFAGYILIGVVMVISRLMGDRIAYKTNGIFSTVAAIIFFITGILAAKDKRDYSNKLFHAQFYLLQMLVATSAFSFINCAVFIVDAALTFWKKIDF